MDVWVFAAVCEPNREHDAAYELLSVAVKQIFGLDELPSVGRMEKGKPFFPDHPEICFNISHSHGAVVCALHDRPVGVDIEKLRPAPKRLANGMDDYSFFLQWTVREATIKMQGRGVGALRQALQPGKFCCTNEELMPGWILAVCPSEESDICFRRM